MLREIKTFQNKLLRGTKMRNLQIKFKKNLFNPYPANVENMVTSNNVSKWQMGFNSALKG